MLLCRLAENAYWLGRYLERAEDLARALLAYEDLRLDIPGHRAPGWQRLAALAGVSPEESATLAPGAFIERVILDRKNPSALLGALAAARENLRRARGQFPADCWHTLNPLYLQLAATNGARLAPAALRALLERVVAGCRELVGHVAAAMLRDEVHAFARIGMHLERADMTLRVATIVTETLIPANQSPPSEAPFEDVRWMGLLKSVGAYGTYRHRYHAVTDFARALELMLFEGTFPRSLTHGLAEIARALEGLPRHQEALAAVEACRPAPPVPARGTLAAFADGVLERIAEAGSAIEKSYFRVMDTSWGIGEHPPRVHARRAAPPAESEEAGKPVAVGP
jgi:uncharacterized alpha-E superfamily protein